MAKVVDLQTGAKVPALDDIAGWERAVYTLSNGRDVMRYNPDALIGRQGLDVFRRMRLDEQVKAVMNFKRAAVMGRGWTLSYDDGSPLDEAERELRIKVMTRALNRMRGSFEEGLKKIFTARDFGFSMTEKVITEFQYDGRTYQGLQQLKLRDPCTFFFYQDDYGQLLRVVQRVSGKEQEINLAKFVYYVHNPEFDEFFGRSDLREAYRPWYIKERVDDYWALYLERFAGGFLIVSQNEQSQLAMVDNNPTYESLKTVLRNLHGSTGIILPKGLTATLQFPPTQDAFQQALEAKNLAIAKALLVPNLLGLSESRQGSSLGGNGQSTTQLEAFGWTLAEDATSVQAVVDEQVVKDLGDRNWGDDEYPCFKFKPPSVEHLRFVIDTWVKLTGANCAISTEGDETYLRGLLGMPKREPDAQPLVDPLAQAQHDLAVQGQQFNQDMQVRQQDHAEQQARLQQQQAQRSQYTARLSPFSILEREVRAQAKRLGLEVDEASLERARQYMEAPAATSGEEPSPQREERPVTAVPHGPLRVATMSQFASAVNRVAFTVIASRQETEAARVVDQAAAQVARAVRRLLGNNDQLQTLTDSDVEDVQSLELSSAEKGRLNSTMRAGLRAGWDLGLQTSRNEIDRATGTPRQVFTDLRDRAAAYFDTRAFRMAGDLSDQVRNLIQNELMVSVKYGRSPTQTREAIWGRLVDRGLTTRTYVRQNETDEDVQRALDALWVDTPEQAASYLDTLTRTNMFEAMNEARYAEFTDPALGGFVQALEYSAILDDRTSDICRALDNDVWSADSPNWDTYRPPNHFNCRSVLVPVTRVDGWDGQESPRPNVDPAPGFGSGEK